MDELARAFADQAHFLFVYVREAHPDMFPDHPHHQSYEQKLQHARDLQATVTTPLTILVDRLDGDVHRLYGGLPNMSWVIDDTGRIAFKGGWTVAADLRAVLEMLFEVRRLKRAPNLNSPYYQELISYARELRPDADERMVQMEAIRRQAEHAQRGAMPAGDD